MHGRGSGRKYARRFSNTVNSKCTALGMYVITSSYQGHYGLTYRLYGMDKKNSNALKRGIVIHASQYVNNEGCRGNSYGCTAVSAEALKEMAPYLQTGTLLWIYS